MNDIIQTIAYFAIVAIGITGLIACLLLAIYGVILLYFWVLDTYLNAKKLRGIFREFIWQRAIHDGKPGKKE